MEYEKDNIYDCREIRKYAPYSDECDLSEDIMIFGLDKIMNADIHLNGRKVELNSIRDLSLYYAFKMAYISKDQDGKLFIELSYVDVNTLQIELFGEHYIEIVKKYRQNWIKAIIANGFDEEFARKWVYEQAYRN